MHRVTTEQIEESDIQGWAEVVAIFQVEASSQAWWDILGSSVVVDAGAWWLSAWEAGTDSNFTLSVKMTREQLE